MKSTLAIALAIAAAALCLSAGPALAEEHKDSVPDTVLAHVEDAHEMEFQNPFTGNQIVWELPSWPVAIGSHTIDLGPTKHAVWMWVAAVLLIVVLSLTASRRTLVPRGFYSVVEAFVKWVRDEIAVPNIGKEMAPRFTPYLITIFFFVVTMNLTGLIPYFSTATGNISITAALALCTFVMTLYAGMKSQGVVGFWTHLVPHGVPIALYPIMVPIELLGLLTKPFALAVRLYANMVAGHIVIFFLLGLIFLLHSAFVAPISVAFAIFIYLLEIFVCLLQAYIFTVLSALFIGLAAHPH